MVFDRLIETLPRGFKFAGFGRFESILKLFRSLFETLLKAVKRYSKDNLEALRRHSKDLLISL